MRGLMWCQMVARKKWMPYLLNFWSLTLAIVSLFSLVDFSLAGSITPLCIISYTEWKITQHVFAPSPYLFQWFSLLLCLSREIIIATVSPMTHIPRIPPPCREHWGPKKKPIGKQHRVKWFHFCIALKCMCLSTLCSYNCSLFPFFL